MTEKEHKTKPSLMELMTGDRDLLKALMQQALQTVLEGEMTDCLGAAPGERKRATDGLSSGYYSRQLVTRHRQAGIRVCRGP
ncbi:MAG: transposase [Methylotetracoccus sp.]